MKASKPDISVVIVNYNTKSLLKKCLDSIIQKSKEIDLEIIVVDNASTDGSLQYLNKIKKTKGVRVITSKKNLGFSKANNEGIRISKGKYVLLLNSDTELKSNLLKHMYDWMDKNKNLGVATCKLVYPNGDVQSAGGYFPTLSRVLSWMILQDLPFVDRLIKPFQPHKELSPLKNDNIYNSFTRFEWLAGTFFMIRRKALDEVGYLDEDYFMYTEDVDYCYRLKTHGWGVGYNPEYGIIHHKGASGTSDFSVNQEFKGVKIFYKKHYPKWQFSFLLLLLKIGALGRALIFLLLGNIDRSKIYAKAFRTI